MRPILVERTVLRLKGPDARGFLNNLVTNDLERLAASPCVYAGLLSAQGKVLADMFIWSAGASDLMIEADLARGRDLLRRLLMFRLRAAVEISDVSAAYAVLIDHDGEGGVVDPRRPDGALGSRALASRAALGDACADPASLLARRLAVGAPDLATDAGPEEVFALEALFEELHGVDFKKGCFVGQENVSRMKRRATTRKKFCPLAFDGDPPAPLSPVHAGEVEIGTVRSGGPGRALALLRLDRVRAALDQGAPLLVDGREMRFDPPPWLILPEGA